MQDYSLIKSVLSGIFSASVGYTEDQAIKELQSDAGASREFRDGLERELRQAFSDETTSWQRLFTEYEVGFFDTEDEARRYARKMLWTSLFNE